MVLQAIQAYLRRRKLRAHDVDRSCVVSTRTYGARSGLWTVHDEPLAPGSVVYSFGVGDNIAWDLEMIERHGVELHAFDPTPRSQEWIARQELPAGFHFHPCGLAHFDGDLELFPPKNESKINYTSFRTPSRTAAPIRCPVRRLRTLADELGHARIDVLKMDIEGAEMQALPDVLDSGIPIGQLLVEFHYNHPPIGFDATVGLIHEIERAGFDVFHISDRGYEFSFLRRAA